MTRAGLTADCGACRGLCCVGPGFVASSDFAIDKPAGRPCPHLADDARCAIHDRLSERGFPGCVTFDCFGAGQRVVAGTPDGADTAFAALEVVRALHEILWYLHEAREHDRAAPLRPEVTALAARVDAAAAAATRAPDGVDVAAWRAEAGPLLGRVADLVRAPAGPDLARRDLVGRDLRDADLTGAGLRGALLLGADLRGADLARADLLGADLRGADVRGADLGDAVFLTHPQLAAARGDATTRTPPWCAAPGPWPSGSPAQAVALPTPVAPRRPDRQRARRGRAGGTRGR